MQRTTISLPDHVTAALRREARRRRVPVSQVAREAIEARLGLNTGTQREIPFAALGHSGERNTARDAEEILRREWATAIDRDR
jgi:predicted transcriptional regulator